MKKFMMFMANAYSSNYGMMGFYGFYDNQKDAQAEGLKDPRYYTVGHVVRCEDMHIVSFLDISSNPEELRAWVDCDFDPICKDSGKAWRLYGGVE